MRNQAAGATKLPTCPSDLSLAAIRSADPRSANGPTRTRYRTEDLDPPGSTNTENPWPLSWRVKFSAFARLAKLPSCTDQDALLMGEDAEDSSGRAAAGRADANAVAPEDVGTEIARPEDAGPDSAEPARPAGQDAAGLSAAGAPPAP